MQQDIIDSIVTVDFYFCSAKLDFVNIDKLMEIVADEKRSKESFRFEEFAKDYWIISTGKEISEDINIQLSKIISIIKKKKDIINNICKQYNALCGFCIVIERYNDIVPAIYYERDFLKFVSDINAEINMDFT